MEPEISESSELDSQINLECVNNEEEKNEESNVPQLSKRQMKKQQKILLWESTKKEKRKAERQRTKERRKMRRLASDTPLGPSRKELKLNKPDDAKSPCSVAIDLSFDEKMSDKDCSKCVKQLLRVYTANRRAKNPISLHFTGLKEDSKVYGHLKRNDGFDRWDVNYNEKPFMDIFEDKDKIVYLTSESDNILDQLEKDHIYVIGGLVDHNQHKGLCHDIASNLGIKHARLPLSENIIIKTRVVLTINQVFEILLGVASEGKSWQKTLLEVLPMRKGAQPKDIPAQEEESDNKDIKEES